MGTPLNSPLRLNTAARAHERVCCKQKKEIFQGNTPEHESSSAGEGVGVGGGGEERFLNLLEGLDKQLLRLHHWAATHNAAMQRVQLAQVCEHVEWVLYI